MPDNAPNELKIHGLRPPSEWRACALGHSKRGAHRAGSKIHIGARMTEFSFPHVSVASAGECFQISFDERDVSEESYFLIQRQFESNDDDLLYLECQDDDLCGHLRIVSAELERDVFRLQVACEPARMVQIRFRAGSRRYKQLRRFLKIMMPARILSIVEDGCREAEAARPARL